MTPTWTLAFDINFILNEKCFIINEHLDAEDKLCCTIDQAMSDKAKGGKIEREVDEKYSYKSED